MRRILGVTCMLMLVTSCGNNDSSSSEVSAAKKEAHDLGDGYYKCYQNSEPFKARSLDAANRRCGFKRTAESGLQIKKFKCEDGSFVLASGKRAARIKCGEVDSLNERLTYDCPEGGTVTARTKELAKRKCGLRRTGNNGKGQFRHTCPNGDVVWAHTRKAARRKCERRAASED